MRAMTRKPECGYVATFVCRETTFVERPSESAVFVERRRSVLSEEEMEVRVAEAAEGSGYLEQEASADLLKRLLDA